MRRRTLIVIGIVEVALLLVGVYYEPRCSIRGRLRGEPFFEGKSATWWSYELGNWEVERRDIRSRRLFTRPGHYFHFTRTRTRLHDISDGFRDRFQPEEEIVSRRFERIFATRNGDGPKILDGDADALLVLFALLDDPSPKVRRFARIGLRLETVNASPTPDPTSDELEIYLEAAP